MTGGYIATGKESLTEEKSWDPDGRETYSGPMRECIGHLIQLSAKRHASSCCDMRALLRMSKCGNDRVKRPRTPPRHHWSTRSQLSTQAEN